MSNGKFFTGLTERMMTRDPTKNRLPSTMFWPDDSAAPDEPVKLGRGRTRSGTHRPSPPPENTDKKELVTSQDRSNNHLASGIEFYDYQEKIPVAHQKMVDLDMVKRSKPDPLRSKIEFYDYEDTTPVHRRTKSPPRQPELIAEREGTKKRISFHMVADEPKRGILKTQEHQVSIDTVAPELNYLLAKKQIVSRKNISKSVENLAMDNLRLETVPNRELLEKKSNGNAVQIRKSLNNEYVDQRESNYNGDYVSERRYSRDIYDTQPTKRVVNEHRTERTEIQSRSRGPETRRVPIVYEEEYDNYGARNLANYQPPSEDIGRNHRPLIRRNSHQNDYHCEPPQRANPRRLLTQSMSINGDRTSESGGGDRTRAHRHLKSNIFFTNDSAQRS